MEKSLIWNRGTNTVRRMVSANDCEGGWELVLVRDEDGICVFCGTGCNIYSFFFLCQTVYTWTVCVTPTTQKTPSPGVDSPLDAESYL